MAGSMYSGTAGREMASMLMINMAVGVETISSFIHSSMIGRTAGLGIPGRASSKICLKRQRPCQLEAETASNRDRDNVNKRQRDSVN